MIPKKLKKKKTTKKKHMGCNFGGGGINFFNQHLYFKGQVRPLFQINLCHAVPWAEFYQQWELLVSTLLLVQLGLQLKVLPQGTCSFTFEVYLQVARLKQSRLSCLTFTNIFRSTCTLTFKAFTQVPALILLSLNLYILTQGTKNPAYGRHRIS